MQTFLPSPRFTISLSCLDRQRLGKQRVEVWQLLNKHFPHHPCHAMWQGYRNCLAYYGLVACYLWRARGYRDSLLQKIGRFYRPTSKITFPPWLGNQAFHASHRSNLLRKNFPYYSQLGWKESPNLPYIWPRTY